VRELALANRRITILEVADVLGISFGSVQRKNKLKSGMWGWFLHHDNASAHSTLFVPEIAV
jgi:hypothetical protein